MMVSIARCFTHRKASEPELVFAQGGSDVVGLWKVRKLLQMQQKREPEKRQNKTVWYQQGTGLFRITDQEQNKVYPLGPTSE